MARILYLETADRDDPTRARVQLRDGRPRRRSPAGNLLAGEAAYLMKDGVLGAVQPVAMPPLTEMLGELTAQRVPIYV